jgi:hypothetical protein
MKAMILMMPPVFPVAEEDAWMKKDVICGEKIMKLLINSSLLFSVLATMPLMAQENSSSIPSGIVENPCLPMPVMTNSVRELLTGLFMEPRTLTQADFGQLMGSEEFASYNSGNQRMGSQDWPGLCRFRADNARLMSSNSRPDMVFMGDSITENWVLGDPALFGDEFVNRGIGGQTAPQMLVRFRADVVALKPQRVHIMAGTNDVAGNTGPSTLQDFRNNIMSMVDLARANEIEVILASIPPAAAFNWQPSAQPAPCSSASWVTV